MNVLIHGPFGSGSLADEAQLAGLLARFSSTQHGVTVFSADPDETRLLHGGVKALKHESPKNLLSNRAAWAAFDQSHLFVLCTAGVINDEGEFPARAWLGQLELVQKVHLKSAVVGVRVQTISDKRESVRAQRLLHHFADTVSVRDEVSKRVLAELRVNPNRVSVNGDPTLGLAPVPSRPEAKRIALFLSTTVPTRTEFSYAPATPAADYTARVKALLEDLLKSGHALAIFHDGAAPVMDFVRDAVSGLDADRFSLIAPDRPFAEILSEVARCETAFSCSYHGILLSALCGVPVTGFSNEPGAPELLKALGLEAYVLAGADFSKLPAMLAKMATDRTALTAALEKRIADLRRKEAQNLRALLALVPKREVYAKEKARAKDIEAENPDPLESPRRVPRKRPRRD